MIEPARTSGPRVDLGLVIFLTPLLWGLTFPATKEALSTLPVLPLTAWSRVLGFAAILVSVPFVARGELTRESLRRIALPGLLLGALMFLGYTLQTAGLEETTATNAGFITGLYVVLTPLLELICFRMRASGAAWGAAAISVVGLGLLSIADFGDLRPRSGDLLVLAGAVAWAGHIAAVGRLAPRYPGRLLSLAQMGWAGVLHTMACVFTTGLRFGDAVEIWPLLILTGVLGSGVAFTLQVLAQQELSAARAAVILAGEAIVSAIAAAIWIDERLLVHQWIGAMLIIGAMATSELGSRRRPEERLDPAAG